VYKRQVKGGMNHDRGQPALTCINVLINDQFLLCMDTFPAQRQRSLTPDRIQQLLSDNGRSLSSADYVRLMEIYCVVKAGGTAAQVSAAQRLAATERAALLAEIEELSAQAAQGNRIEALRQEIQEVERSVAHRIAYLHSIDPQEAASVQSCMALIDTYFANLG